MVHRALTRGVMSDRRGTRIFLRRHCRRRIDDVGRTRVGVRGSRVSVERHVRERDGVVVVVVVVGENSRRRRVSSLLHVSVHVLLSLQARHV